MLSVFNKQTTIPTPPPLLTTLYAYAASNIRCIRFRVSPLHSALTSALTGAHCSLIWGCNCACVRGCIRACVCVCVSVSAWLPRCSLLCVSVVIFLGTCCWVYNSRVRHFVDSVRCIKHTPWGTQRTSATSVCMYGCVRMRMYVSVCIVFVVEQIRELQH